MSEQRFCPKCRRTMVDTNFYTLKSGQKSDLCKSCETLHINNTDPSTFLWLLEKYDVPYIPAEWDVLYQRAYQKDPYKINGMSVFGKYLSKMKLKQWKMYTYADSGRLQAEAEEKAKKFGTPQEIVEQKIADMEEAYQNGEITEAQFLTYKEIQREERMPEFTTIAGSNTITTAGPGGGGPYPVNENPFEKIDIPDPGEELTAEDKLYLATKWGRLYTAADWLYLEKKYYEFVKSFDIQGAARIDTLIQICKLSLKLNQALDTGDMDSYSKLVRAYDSLMKSAKFTEAQRKEEKSGEFDSVGQIVYFAELEGGKIERFDTHTNLDIFDKAIENLKRYNKELILNDPSLAQQLENYLRRRTALDKAKENKIKAAEDGEEVVTLKDEDFAEYNDMIAADKEKDAAREG